MKDIGEKLQIYNMYRLRNENYLNLEKNVKMGGKKSFLVCRAKKYINGNVIRVCKFYMIHIERH